MARHKLRSVAHLSRRCLVSSEARRGRKNPLLGHEAPRSPYDAAGIEIVMASPRFSRPRDGKETADPARTFRRGEDKPSRAGREVASPHLVRLKLLNRGETRRKRGRGRKVDEDEANFDGTMLSYDSKKEKASMLDKGEKTRRKRDMTKPNRNKTRERREGEKRERGDFLPFTK